jgi:hypothetical protein
MKDRLAQWILLFLAIQQILVPALPIVRNEPMLNEQTANPQITPAGYTFSIWGLITLLSLCYAIYQILPSQREKPWAKDLAWPLAGVYTTFTLWLAAAILDLTWGTLFIFGAMYFLLFVAMSRIQQYRSSFNVFQQVLIHGQIGIYFGWASIAIFANLAANLKEAGLRDDDQMGLYWQAAILIIAAINALYNLYRFGGWPYPATVIWALVGAYFGVIRFSNTELLSTLCLVLIGIIVAAALYFNLRQPRESKVLAVS